MAREIAAWSELWAPKQHLEATILSSVPNYLILLTRINPTHKQKEMPINSTSPGLLRGAISHPHLEFSSSLIRPRSLPDSCLNKLEIDLQHSQNGALELVMSFWSKWKIPTHRRIMLILLTPPGIAGASIFGYFELNWQRMKRDCETNEQNLAERMCALERKLQQYDWKTQGGK